MKHAKTDIRYWQESIFRRRFKYLGKTRATVNYSARFQHLGRRETISLGTPNRAAAAARAREIYLHLLHRLRGVFLTALGAEETQIEASFCEAIRIAKEQKSVWLEKRAEATYTEYRRQKASGAGGRGFRLPLC